ncbi:MAG: hypothetical protein ACTHOR_19035, partial [Devosia sp.]
RIGALEETVPQLRALIATRPADDPAIVTGAIGTPQRGFSPASGPVGSDEGSASTAPAPATPISPSSPTLLAWARPALTIASAAGQARQQMPGALDTSPASAAAPTVTGAPPSNSPAGAGAGEDSAAIPASAASAPAAASPRPDVIAEGEIPPTPMMRDGLASSAGDTAPNPVPATMPSQGSVKAVGVAIGAPVRPDGALAAWQVLAAKVGILLVGTSPLLADDPAGSNGKVLVAGPLPDVPAAARLCAEIDRAGISCTPMPYVGGPITAAGSHG